MKPQLQGKKQRLMDAAAVWPKTKPPRLLWPNQMSSLLPMQSTPITKRLAAPAAKRTSRPTQISR